MLSAQSTDAKVNTVTPELFSRGPDAGAMAVMEVWSRYAAAARWARARSAHSAVLAAF